MAKKTAGFDSDPTVMAKATELKKELQKLVRIVVDDDDYNTETIDQADEKLCALKDVEIKKKRSLSINLADTVLCPDEFKCPLSNELMKDPVILATGQTYDRSFIQNWLKAGNRTCPLTQQVLSHTILTPNHLIRKMISEWCRSQGFEFPDDVRYINEEGTVEADRDHFLSLLGKMSLSLPQQKAAAKELRMLTKTMPKFRALFGEFADAIPRLLSPLLTSKSQNEIHPGLEEDVITTLLNLSIHDSNKKLVGETPMAIPFLLEALKSGTIGTRTNAAAAIFTLSSIDSNKSLIGKSGALKLLLELLEEGHPLAMNDVAYAVFTLCFDHENKARAVRDGAVKVILKKIMDGVLVNELLAILAILSGHHRATEEMGELGAVPCLISIIRESSCERNKENCIAILHTICSYDRTKWKALQDEESAHGTISKLAREGTSRAKRKANAILDRLNRSVNLTHTA